MAGSVIVAGARTPIGRLLGSLKGLAAVDLGAVAIRAALERAGVTGEQVDYVIMGHVLQAGAGQIPSRQAAVKAGIPMSVPSLTINKVCLSGLDAIALADQLIRAGEFDIVVAGGMESMTNAPHLLPKSRHGYKYGSIEVLDATAHDGLTDAFDGVSMGESTEGYNAKLGISREEQDEFSARSHQRAAEAAKNGLFDDEIVPVEIPQRRGAAGRSHGGGDRAAGRSHGGGDRAAGRSHGGGNRNSEAVVFRTDEGVRADTTAESLGRLRPAFSKDGTITAGSSSQISDGACAVVVMSKAKAEELGLTWLAEIGAHGNVAGPDNSLQSQPANAIKHALGKQGLDVGDVDLIEINEAFASVGVQSMRDLGVEDSKVNVNGGAIALGHPIGMSGARIVLHLAYELRRRGGGVGAAGLCGGGGQGDALILKV
jgi:acetyl-CoA C-acetyltransferase